MSRLIVRGIPSYLSDGRLREHFSQKGLVTDVKVMTRPDGTSRRFGFVGFRSEAEAKDALEYFNRTFIDTSRIQVEFAKKIGDDTLAEKKAKRQNDKSIVEISDRNSQNEKAAGRDKVASGGKSKASVPATKGVSFEEFMSVMAPKKKRKVQDLEDPAPSAVPEAKAVTTKVVKKNAKEAGAPDKIEPAKTSPDAVEDDTNADSDAEAQPDEALNDEGLTDLDYLHQRMKRNVGVEAPAASTDKAFEQSDSEDGASDGAESDAESDDEETRAKFEKQRLALEEKAKKDQEAVDTIMTSGRLFVRNLPFAATETELEDHFLQYGPIKQTHITIDKATKTSKGMAFVHFEEPAHALAAYRAADGSTFQGRLLHLLPAVDLKPKPEAGKNLKQTRAEERQSKATQSFNWSMLYMSGDAVASSVADRLGVDKSDILNPSDDAKGDSAAVRLALAEAKVIQETKEFLASEGINLGAFETSKTKGSFSDTTILVKNIPYGTTSETIREMFERHGEVDRVLIPPTGTLALVEMVVPGEARVAFKALAYKRVGNSILYLEKAPANVFTDNRPSSYNAKDVAGQRASIQAPASKQQGVDQSGANNAEEQEANATLFVKNLSFATTDAGLAKLFGTLADFVFARVQTRIDARDPSKRLSMGYGFAGYRSVAAAQTALNMLNGKDLDGHALALSFARRGQDDDDASRRDGGKAGGGSKKSSTKLVVKNLPFEATKKDVRALFSAHGELKSVRVPRKAASVAGASGGGARGFAFVEFTSKREAEVAFEALRHAHYLGRHLVLQWDSEEAAGLEGIREKVKESFQAAAAAAGGGSSRRKKAKLDLGEEAIAEASRKERQQRDDMDED